MGFGAKCRKLLGNALRPPDFWARPPGGPMPGWVGGGTPFPQGGLKEACPLALAISVPPINLPFGKQLCGPPTDCSFMRFFFLLVSEGSAVPHLLSGGQRCGAHCRRAFECSMAYHRDIIWYQPINQHFCLPTAFDVPMETSSRHILCGVPQFSFFHPLPIVVPGEGIWTTRVGWNDCNLRCIASCLPPFMDTPTQGHFLGQFTGRRASKGA